MKVLKACWGFRIVFRVTISEPSRTFFETLRARTPNAVGTCFSSVAERWCGAPYSISFASIGIVSTWLCLTEMANDNGHLCDQCIPKNQTRVSDLTTPGAWIGDPGPKVYPATAPLQHQFNSFHGPVNSLQHHQDRLLLLNSKERQTDQETNRWGQREMEARHDRYKNGHSIWHEGN